MPRSKAVPFNHAASHEAGGGDVIDGLLDGNGRVAVRKNSGAVAGTRRRLNLIEGAGVTLTVADDSGNEEIDITIASTGGYTDEQAQDAVGAMVASSARVSLTYVDAAPSLTPDLVADSVGVAYMHASASGVLFGRSTAAAGVGEEIACTAAGRAILDDATATVQRATLGIIDTTEVIAGDTTMTTQRLFVQVTAAAKITLPTVASWVIGQPTTFVYRGTTKINVVFAANAADKIEGAALASVYGTEFAVIITPIVANRFTVEVLRGVAMWEVCRFDFTAASGASPWTLTNAVDGVGRVWTDISSGGSSIAVSTGFVATAASGTGAYGADAGTGSAIRTPLITLTDGWGRPLSADDDLWILAAESKTTAVGGSTPSPTVGMFGATLSGVPRVGASDDSAGTLSYKARVAGTTFTDNGSPAYLTTAHWLGVEWDGTRRNMRSGLLNAATAGNPGVDWWPATYESGDGIIVGQDYYGKQLPLTAFTGVVWAMNNGTTGSKFTATALSILRVVRGIGD